MIYLQVIASGLLLGGVYALLAVGLTLIFGVMKLVNFAHGDFLMVGMYLVYVLFVNLNINPYLTIPIITIVMFLAGVIVQHFLLRHTIASGHSMQIVMTLGLGLILEAAALMIFTGNYRSVAYEPSIGVSLQIAGISLSTTRIISFLVATAATVLLLLFLDKTLLGKAMRATAQDSTAAGLMGIPVNRIYLLAMGIGTGLVGIGASILSPIFSVYPTIGANIMLLGFVVVVLGGLGSVIGAYVGGLIIGVVEAIAGLFFGGVLSQGIYFLIFIVILLFRPQGLFRGEA